MQDIVDHTLYEGRHDIGGTWLVNDYPGVQCDVPAHIYAFPFDPNPEWNRFYATGPEIQEYIKKTVKKWNLDRDIVLNTEVTRAQWLEGPAQWEVTTLNKVTGEEKVELCDILISAQGVLVKEAWPKNPGLQDFKGHVTHSAAWDHKYDYSGKRIAVIGNGCSGIQIVPKMRELPGTHVMNFVRGPAWVFYRAPPSAHLGRPTASTNPKYTEEEKVKFRDPVEHWKYRKGIIARTNKSFGLFLKGENNGLAKANAIKQMSEKLQHDPRLCDILIPKWELGCRCITPGPGYLESFLQPNCDITNSPITRITESGVEAADGKHFDADVVICATGFDSSYRPRFPLIGEKGVNLAELWQEDPEVYLSVAAPGFPNYFMFTGPNSLGGHGSLVESLNWTGDYFVKWMKKIAEKDIKTVVPKVEVVKSLVKTQEQIHNTLVWTGSCSSWYKRGRVNARVTALFGGSAQLFNRMLRDIRAEDFDIEYRTENHFRFMGNGFLKFEREPDADLSWYVEVADPNPKDSREEKKTSEDIGKDGVLFMPQ
jgi:cation diffusion facilitator CzcD-associated flavoprotein CzcO